MSDNSTSSGMPSSTQPAPPEHAATSSQAHASTPKTTPAPRRKASLPVAISTGVVVILVLWAIGNQLSHGPMTIHVCGVEDISLGSGTFPQDVHSFISTTTEVHADYSATDSNGFDPNGTLVVTLNGNQIDSESLSGFLSSDGHSFAGSTPDLPLPAPTSAGAVPGNYHLEVDIKDSAGNTTMSGTYDFTVQ